jgi:hypothetical protein
VDIEANIERFRSYRHPGRRYASFDFCFNYFQWFRENGRKTADIAAPENMALSCLHLGFYLASWGMFRGPSVRGQSLRQFMPVVELIADTPAEVWEIDADRYSGEACRKLLTTADAVKRELHYPDGARGPTSTMATKIMLGVFGNVPAFDKYVVKGLGKTGLPQRFGLRALHDIGGFYDDHREVIERNLGPTLDFATGQQTQLRYTRAKVIDQIFFIEGGG